LTKAFGAFLQTESVTQAAIDAAWRGAGVRTRCSLEVGSHEALREAVARGLGVGAVSEAEFIADPRFVPIRIDGDPATTSTYLYYARERSRSLLIQSFVQAQRITPQSQPPA
jgi:DNA-binding transcriptional LysR family regulator